MSIVNKVLGLFLGNKYERDLSEVEPFVGKIREESVKLGSISNDQLRDLTVTLKKEITGSFSLEEDEIRTLKTTAENEEDVNAKEEIYNRIDKIDKEILEKLEKKLDEVLPRAFAISKGNRTPVQGK